MQLQQLRNLNGLLRWWYNLGAPDSVRNLPRWYLARILVHHVFDLHLMLKCYSSILQLSHCV